MIKPFQPVPTCSNLFAGGWNASNPQKTAPYSHPVPTVPTYFYIFYIKKTQGVVTAPYAVIPVEKSQNRLERLEHPSKMADFCGFQASKTVPTYAICSNLPTGTPETRMTQDRAKKWTEPHEITADLGGTDWPTTLTQAWQTYAAHQDGADVQTMRNLWRVSDKEIRKVINAMMGVG